MHPSQQQQPPPSSSSHLLCQRIYIPLSHPKASSFQQSLINALKTSSNHSKRKPSSSSSHSQLTDQTSSLNFTSASSKPPPSPSSSSTPPLSTSLVINHPPLQPPQPSQHKNLPHTFNATTTASLPQPSFLLLPAQSVPPTTSMDLNAV
ncbi:hypothetical protein HMI56_002641, partial [Coelomomyces lativittatus]